MTYSRVWRQSTTIIDATHSINMYIIFNSVVGAGRRYEFHNIWVSMAGNDSNSNIYCEVTLYESLYVLFLILKTKVVK